MTLSFRKYKLRQMNRIHDGCILYMLSVYEIQWIPTFFYVFEWYLFWGRKPDYTGKKKNQNSADFLLIFCAVYIECILRQDKGKRRLPGKNDQGLWSDIRGIPLFYIQMPSNEFFLTKLPAIHTLYFFVSFFFYFFHRAIC